MCANKEDWWDIKNPMTNLAEILMFHILKQSRICTFTMTVGLGHHSLLAGLLPLPPPCLHSRPHSPLST